MKTYYCGHRAPEDEENAGQKVCRLCRDINDEAPVVKNEGALRKNSILARFGYVPLPPIVCNQIRPMGFSTCVLSRGHEGMHNDSFYMWSMEPNCECPDCDGTHYIDVHLEKALS